MSLPPSSSSNPTEAPAASGYPAPSATALARSTTIKPDPSNTIPFSWSCSCNNVQVSGRIRKELEEFIQKPKEHEQSTGAPLTSVWVDPRGEQCKMHEYLIFEGPGETRGRERMPSNERKANWRRCLLCDVKIYRVEGLHTRDDHGTRGIWVEIDFDAVIYGPSLSDLLSRPALPFSKLYLPLESNSKPSQFQRLPGAAPPPSYEPNPWQKAALGKAIYDAYILPKPEGVFFGPPRPPVSHPHLHELCEGAEQYLTDRYSDIYSEMMTEIYEIMTRSTEKYCTIEEEVRKEAEFLWNTYYETNAEAREPASKRRGSTAGKAKSRSASRDPVQRKFSPPPKPHPSIHSVIDSATPNKLKNKGSWNQDPADLPEAEDNEPAVPPPFAGSLLTNSLMAHRRQAPAPPVEPSAQYPEELVGEELESTRRVDKTKDQRAVAMSHVFSVLDEQMANRPAKDGKDAIQRAQDGELPRRPVSKKEMQEITAVARSFILPDEDGSQIDLEETDKPPTPPGDDEEVFDFEMEDKEDGPSLAPSAVSLAKTDEYAGHAPSHRKGWKTDANGRVGWNENKDIHDGRSSSRYNPSEADSDGGKISALAQSMPLNIVRQPLRAISGYAPADLEPKTSLSEREGYLVPPLKPAGSRKTVKIDAPPSPSGSRKDEDQPMHERKGFVPPHIQVREEDKALMKASGGSRSIYDK